jgi:hypothetical protein
MIDQMASSKALHSALIASKTGNVCSGELTIEVEGSGTVKVTKVPEPTTPASNIVNGDTVSWDIKMTKKGIAIPNYGIVEIKLSYTTPLLSTPSPCDCSKASQVLVDILEEEDKLKTGSHVYYTVYHDDNPLKWDNATPSPYLVIDHIGDPPEDPKPPESHTGHHGGHHGNRRNSE